MLEKAKMVEMYQKMLEIRYFEEKVFELYGQNLVPGTIHLYAGQEAVAVGVCANLRKDDYITSTHSVQVVFTNKHHWKRPNRRHVNSFMECSLIRGAFPKETRHNLAGPPQFDG